MEQLQKVLQVDVYGSGKCTSLTCKTDVACMDLLGTTYKVNQDWLIIIHTKNIYIYIYIYLGDVFQGPKTFLYCFVYSKGWVSSYKLYL